jgi:hypothetical protein
MPNTKVEVFFRTAGAKRAFVSTTDNSSFVRSGAVFNALATTISNTQIFGTPNSTSAFFLTAGFFQIFKSSSVASVFLTTPTANPVKELVLKIGTLGPDTDCTYVEVPDATGEYNPADPDENPGGYNPPLEPFNPYRPYRGSVKLWTVYRIWNIPAIEGQTQTPSTQAEENDVDYTYTLYFPTENIGNEAVVIKGIYEIILIAAPASEDYAAYEGNINLYSIAQELDDWYVTSVGLMVDCGVINCLNRKRYEFLQGVMCGKCDSDYFVFYSDYIGMLSAMEIQDWPTAVEFYNKLKTQCSAIEPSCGC